MDRTQQSLDSLHPMPVCSSFSVESALFSASADEVPKALFGPLHYEPGYAYPLIVWLHGQGGDERQLLRIMPLVSMRNYVAIAVRGIRGSLPGEPNRQGYGWPQSEAAIGQAEQQVFECIELAGQKFNIARRKVFLAGFDSGGTMAFRVAMNHPSRFAGVLSLCGPFPGGHAPLGNLAEARRLSLLLAVGRHSREYPTAEVCRNLRLFHTAGLSITLRQYPCGHELAPQMLTDIDRWIIEQITSPAGSAERSDHLWSNEAD